MISKDDEAEIARLRRWLNAPDKVHIRDILQRRLFALEHEIQFDNPFGEVDETLFALWR